MHDSHLICTSLVLLLLYQGLDRTSLGFMLIILEVVQLFLHLFLLLRGRDILQNSLLVSLLIIVYLSLLLFFLSFMEEGYLYLFVELHLLAHLLLSLVLHVSSSLINDVTSFLPCLLNFFEGPRLFLLQKVDAISQKSQIVLSPLSGQFSCN